MTAKEKHRKRLLEYLGNPENDFLNRSAMSAQLNISAKTFYRHFAPHEIQEIEKEAYEERKKNSARQRGVVLSSLYTEAKGGNVSAAKEFLDRTEGKVPDKLDATVTKKKIVIRRKTRDGDDD